MQVTTDILIVGAGPVGSILACAMSSQNPDMKIVLLDKRQNAFEQTETDSRAYSLSASSVSMLELLGLWQEIEPFAQKVVHIEITDSELDDTIRPLLLEFDNLIEGETGAWIVESQKLTSILIPHLNTIDHIRLLSGENIESVEHNENGATLLTTSKKEISTSLLIACDGRFSAIRKMVGIGSLSWPSSQMGIVARIGIENAHNATAVQHFLDPGPLALLPLPDKKFSIVWTETKDVAARLKTCTPEAFCNELALRMGDRFGQITLESDRIVHPLEMRLAKEYFVPGVVLCGDAAHAMHWVAGQGLNFGLRDVAVLTELVTDNWRKGLPIGSSLVLEEYQRWRRFDANTFTLAMHSLNTMLSTNNSLLRSVRSAGMQLINQLPAVKNHFIAEAAGKSGYLPKLLKGERL